MRSSVNKMPSLLGSGRQRAVLVTVVAVMALILAAFAAGSLNAAAHGDRAHARWQQGHRWSGADCSPSQLGQRSQGSAQSSAGFDTSDASSSGSQAGSAGSKRGQSRESGQGHGGYRRGQGSGVDQRSDAAQNVSARASRGGTRWGSNEREADSGTRGAGKKYHRSSDSCEDGSGQRGRSQAGSAARAEDGRAASSWSSEGTGSANQNNSGVGGSETDSAASGSTTGVPTAGSSTTSSDNTSTAGNEGTQPMPAPSAPVAAPPAPLGQCTTGGSAGASGNVSGQSHSGGSGTSEYDVFAEGISTTQPVGLLLHFHGDGASGYGVKEIAAAAKQKNLITVAMDSPGGSTWWQSGSSNAEWVKSLLENVIYKQYNIDRSKVVLVGYSGGAQFITKYLIPGQPSLFCGGAAIMFGGGGSPGGGEDGGNSTLSSTMKMHWYTGQDDNGSGSGASSDGYDALSDSDRGAQYYKSQGYTTTVEHPSGVNHNNIDFGEVVSQQLSRLLG